MVGAVVILAGCDGSRGLDDIKRSGELVVLTRNGPTMLYESREGTDGYEYALTQALAESLDVRVRYRLYDNIPSLLAAIERGDGHLAAAAITRTDARAKRYPFGPDYKAVEQQVVCHRDGPLPGSLEELPSVTLRVIAGSSYEERLRELEEDLPALRWDASDELSTDEILAQVWRREIDCAVADSNIVAVHRRHLPELAVAFALTESQPLAWVLPPDTERLADYLHEWFQAASSNGLLQRLDERYYGHVASFDYVDLKVYQRRIDERLPKFRRWFEAASAKHRIPWLLLAAQAYQESHWDPKATSPTGVRGMTMLTRAAAKEVGVANRLDPKQSIFGGAKYLQRMLSRLPEEVEGEDRLWLGLAAYNVGFGHLQDARELAKKLGHDPNAWHSLKGVLPLLARKKYYRSLKHGYARGLEPVRYVERVREYQAVLEGRIEN